MKPVWILMVVAAMLALGAVSASAQPVLSAKSGTVAYIEGKVYLDNQLVEQSATHFPEIKENSVVRTEDGRAEILLTPGVTLRLGENGSFRMVTNRLIDTRLELLTGSAVVVADEIRPDTSVTVVCKDGAVALSKVGGYRFDTEPARIKVFKGVASVQIAGQSILVGAGKMLSLAGTTASVDKFDAEDTDSLDRWSRVRAGYMEMANISAAKYMRDNYPLQDAGMWGWNPYYGMYTFIPGGGSRLCNPFYGFCYWTPRTVYRAFYVPTSPWWGYNSASNAGFGYPTMPQTSSGYSGTMGASSSVSMSPAAASAGSSAASAAASSSVGRGSATSGGHGR